MKISIKQIFATILILSVLFSAHRYLGYRRAKIQITSVRQVYSDSVEIGYEATHADGGIVGEIPLRWDQVGTPNIQEGETIEAWYRPVDVLWLKANAEDVIAKQIRLRMRGKLHNR